MFYKSNSLFRFLSAMGTGDSVCVLLGNKENVDAK